MDNLNNALQTSRQNLPATIKSLFTDAKVKARFEEILGKKAAGFMSSVINVTNNNNLLKKAEPSTVMSAAVVAASLDLPIDPNLGFSYIVPYAGNAQFQMGYKGFVQLAYRSGQYQKFTAVFVHENQFKSWNALTETLDADFTVIGEGDIKGIAVYFKLVNGFDKTLYFPYSDLLSHGKRYSKSYNNGPWKTHTAEMCMKTAIKQTLSKWGVLSVDMQTALKVDQAVIKKDNLDEPDAIEYPDAVETDFEMKETTLDKDFQGKQAEIGG